ncbi:MAG: hypothetical protein ACYC7F_02610 [Gemmatimonadaceae bacterium]
MAFLVESAQVNYPKAWRQVFRRAVAVLALLGLVAMPAETMSPDIHDGDAAVSTSTAAASMADEATGHAVGQDRDGSPAESPAPGHSTHVEHCGHAHVFVQATPIACATDAGLPEVELSGMTGIPASVPRSPEQRPPIA